MRQARVPDRLSVRGSGCRPDPLARARAAWRPIAATDSETSITILDEIGASMFGDGVTAKRVAAALRAIGARPVTVQINSPGGDYFEALAIYNLLRGHGAPVSVHVLGLAASAASVIAMAGDSVHIAPAGFFMIHNAHVMAYGDRNGFAEMAETMAEFDRVMASVYAARTGLPEGEIAAMMDAETWIAGDRALELGLADAALPAADVLPAQAVQDSSASLGQDPDRSLALGLLALRARLG